MEKSKIYIASPLGFSEVGREFMYSKIIPIIQKEYEVLDPWKLTSKELIDSVFEMPYGQEKKEKWKEVNKIIAENNVKAMDEASGMFAVLDGVDVDSGTASEIGYMNKAGKPILGYRGDFRLSADNEGSIVNLQVESFIESKGKIITQIKDLEEGLREVFG